VSPLDPGTWQETWGAISSEQKTAALAVAAGAIGVIVLSVTVRRFRKLLILGILGLTASAAWWWASAHGVVDQVHDLIQRP